MEERRQVASTEYRARIYEKYASRFQGAKPEFDRKAAARWGRAYVRFLRGWLPERKDVAICDLACGGGRLLHLFQSLGYGNLTGVDVSPEQVALARQVTGNVVEADVLEFLETKTEAYDLLTALDLIEHFTKDEVLRFLDGCHRALRPGGRLILQTLNAQTPWGLADRYGDFSHELGFSPVSLSHLLTVCGFEDFGAREGGPVIHGLKSLVRWVLWRCLRRMLWFWNLVETGSTGGTVFTRVFLITGLKP